MTKEEREKAIDLLDNLIGMVEDNQDNDYDKALRMGIESLRKEPIQDCVSRAIVLTLINDVKRADGFKDYSQYEYLFDQVDKMPMATPTRKKGHWILLDECANSGYYCSKCHKKVVKEGWSDTVKKIKYCPHCGAKMESEQLLSYADQDTMQPAT